MKKILTLILVILTTGIFAADWYSKSPNSTLSKASKDTMWQAYTAGETSGWVMREFAERATYYHVDDFNDGDGTPLEYPIYLHGVNAYFQDSLYTYNYRLYDKEGTMIWESSEGICFEGNNSIYFDPPLVLADDFWFSVVPNASGFPSQFAAGITDLTVETHSYLSDGAGGWIKQFDNINGEDQNLENFYDVLLSPYDGADVFVPLAKGIAGSPVYADRDMNLELVCQDQNEPLSPMASQYSFDGINWTDFEMVIDTTAAKGNFIFKGILPAQTAGTTASVKFFMDDQQGNSTWSQEFEVEWTLDVPFFSEDFENEVWPPDGWSFITTSAGWQEAVLTSGGFVHGGAKSAKHEDVSGSQDDWLVTDLISLPSDNSCTLSLWQAARWLSYMVGDTTAVHEIAISLDGSTNWTRIWKYDQTDFAIAPQVNGEFHNEIISLVDYIGQDIYIGFHYGGIYTTEWYIDDIEIWNDYKAPEITSIIANEALDPIIGAYLNNDMNISLDVYDMTGVESIVGHYSLEGGTITGDIDFTKSKGVEEVWTGTVPAMATVSTGTIYFDLTDVGGKSGTSIDYNIEFVQDNDNPIFTYVTGRDVWIGEPMNLEVAFSDESAITSCFGNYVKQAGADSVWFALTPSKINKYIYNGVLPAETEEVFYGQVSFTIIDAENNTTNSDEYRVRWLDGQLEATDDFESGYGNWGSNGDWAIVQEGEYVSATSALTESPGGDYKDKQSTFVMWQNFMDWSTYMGGSVSFWCKYDLEAGFDYMYFQGSPDGGFQWVTLKTWNGEGVDWHEELIPMDAFAGGDQVTFRFLFQSDQGYHVNGMYIDDIVIKTYNNDIAAPTIDSDPFAPEFYEGPYGDYNGEVRVIDVSGVNAVNVLYSVDGGATQTVAATDSGTDNIWTYTIPQQPSGSVVDFWFWAEDTTVKHNAGYSPTYTYIAGEHLIYDNGVVSYISNIVKDDALAARMTVPGTDSETTYGADLNYLLLKNYADLDSKSDSMTVRVWQDDGTGQPGVEVITPIKHLPEANNMVDPEAMSMIDLRPQNVRVYGDFWIGFSAEIGDVWYCYTQPSELGSTYYARSYNGISNGDGTWTWSRANDTNFHFRAILGEATSIEEGNNIPMTTSLEQNYPNPFNPTTTINFTIAEEAKTSLVVYDVMGRVVAKLVDGNLSKGSHKVTFDASNLVSGVYYYNLKSGNVNQTKKMMMLK